MFNRHMPKNLTEFLRDAAASLRDLASRAPDIANELRRFADELEQDAQRAPGDDRPWKTTRSQTKRRARFPISLIRQEQCRLLWIVDRAPIMDSRYPCKRGSGATRPDASGRAPAPLPSLSPGTPDTPQESDPSTKHPCLYRGRRPQLWR